MIRITDTTAGIGRVYGPEGFRLDRWKEYMARYVPGAAEGCLEDMEESIRAGYSWERSFLPVLNAIRNKPERLEQAILSFQRVTDRLEERVCSGFGRSPDAEIVLYLGLCSGAGWVTEFGGRTVILLGIEKIIELGWCGTDDMNALILHELGHVFHRQFGVFPAEPDRSGDRFLLQLFSEGIAMVFEQDLLGDEEYFTQGDDGWKNWCRSNLNRIAQEFDRDLSAMTRKDQRYFGDWVRFEGRPDVGYYLGARFVRFLMRRYSLEGLITFGMPEIRAGWKEYCILLRETGNEPM